MEYQIQTPVFLKNDTDIKDPANLTRTFLSFFFLLFY